MALNFSDFHHFRSIVNNNRIIELLQKSSFFLFGEGLSKFAISALLDLKDLFPFLGKDKFVDFSIDDVFSKVAMRRKRTQLIMVLQMNAGVCVKELLLVIEYLFGPSSVNFGVFDERLMRG